MKYGWLICNTLLQGIKYQEIHDLYIESAKSLGITLEVVSNDQVLTMIDHGLKLHFNHQPCDFVLFLDKDIKLAQILEANHIPVFNNARVIEICDSKIKTHMVLKDIPSPKTIFAPSLFFDDLSNNLTFRNLLKQQLDYPMVVKEEFGSFGKQVYLVSNDEELISLQRQLGCKPHLYQEYIEESSGQDIRIQMVGNKVIACVKRTSNNDFRSNATLGGSMSNITLDQSYYDIAYQIQALLQADFCGIDLLITKNGPLLCEVNSNAHVKNLIETTNINVCDVIMEYIYEKVYQ